MITASQVLKSVALTALLAAALGSAAGQGAGGAQGSAPQTAAQPPAGGWQPMFDGKTLAGWKEADFAGRGKVTIQDGSVILGMGAMTGVNWVSPFPKSNYEVRWEAERVQGSDFFASLTFPVRDSFLTWVNGGWGGSIVGLSSLDDNDASENETASVVNFENNHWYAFRLRVTDDAVEAWIDDQAVISVETSGRKLSLRPGDIEQSIPFGFATYSTVGALRKIEYRVLPPAGDAKP
jgi:hypothetical protein